MKIIIDPGHGGSEIGAVAGELIEKNLNLIYATKIYDILKTYNCDVWITRKDNASTLPLDKRCEWIREFKPDLVLSCHFNAGGGSGVETIYSLHAPDSVRELATDIARYISQNTSVPVRRVFTRASSKSTVMHPLDYYGLHRNGSYNTVIVEPLFLDNVDDSKVLKIDGYMWKLASTIASSVISRYKLTKKDAPKPLSWTDIIDKYSSKPDQWIKAIDAAVRMAQDKSNYGDLEILEYLPELIVKIYNKKL